MEEELSVFIFAILSFLYSYFIDYWFVNWGYD